MFNVLQVNKWRLIYVSNINVKGNFDSREINLNG